VGTGVGVAVGLGDGDAGGEALPGAGAFVLPESWVDEPGAAPGPLDGIGAGDAVAVGADVAPDVGRDVDVEAIPGDAEGSFLIRATIWSS
jgi:hypothetical protein